MLHSDGMSTHQKRHTEITLYPPTSLTTPQKPSTPTQTSVQLHLQYITISLLFFDKLDGGTPQRCV